MLQHPDSDRLSRALERCLSVAVSWKGEVYRSASPRYGNKDDLLTGAGSKTAGARWNPPNSFRTEWEGLLVPSAARSGGIQPDCFRGKPRRPGKLAADHQQG